MSGLIPPEKVRPAMHSAQPADQKLLNSSAPQPDPFDSGRKDFCNQDPSRAHRFPKATDSSLSTKKSPEKVQVVTVKHGQNSERTGHSKAQLLLVDKNTSLINGSYKTDVSFSED